MSYKLKKELEDSYIYEIVKKGEDLENVFKSVYNKTKSHVSLPGFRKGKVPYAMAVKHYGKEVFLEDAMQEILKEEMAKIADKELESKDDLNLKVSPHLDVEDATPDKIILTIKYFKLPKVDLKKYKGLEVEKETVKVSKKEIKDSINEEAEKNSRLVVKETAAKKGDIVNIDFKGFTEVDGEMVPFEGGEAKGHDLELGSNTFIPGFEDQLIGSKAGDEVEVKVTFPKEYGAENLAGKDAKFETIVNSVKTKELPKIDDEFAKDLGYDDLAQLEAAKEKEIKAAKEEQANNVLAEKLYNQLIDLNEVKGEIETEAREEVELNAKNMEKQYTMYGIKPEDLYKTSGTTREEYIQNETKLAINRLKVNYILEEVAKKEKLDSDKKMLEEVIEEYKKHISPEEAKDFKFEKQNENVQNLLKSIAGKKSAYEFVKDNAKAVKEAPKKASKAVKSKTDSKKETKTDAKKTAKKTVKKTTKKTTKEEK